MNERSGRANNKRFRGAAIVFALLAAASTTIFVLTKDKSPDASLENDISAESAVSEESETAASETAAPVTETAPAHIVTASPDDMRKMPTAENFMTKAAARRLRSRQGP